MIPYDNIIFPLILCMLGNFVCFLSSGDYFKISFFKKNKLSGIQSDCLTVWIQFGPNILIWVQAICKFDQHTILAGGLINYIIEPQHELSNNVAF